ncbi:MAG TPA: OmpW family outer membrane protein [Kofleriaceae bacterium]|nr:OmpW family outer membrane protein [Kofleriaceae bacterium]
MKKQIALAGAAAALVLVLAPAAASAEPWWSRLYLRGGVTRVAPLEQSRAMELADIEGAASLAVQNGPIADSGATVSSVTIGAVSLGVKVPELHEGISFELVVAKPPTLKFRATGTLANESIAPMALGIPTGVPALGPELGDVQAAPVVLTAVYQLRDRGVLRPYVGTGPALLLAMGKKITNPILTEVSQPEFDIAPAPGLVLQAGLDAKLWKSVYARIDVKFIAGMLARAEVHHIQVRTPELPLFDTVEVGTAKMSVWVNPVIVQAGVGFDFDML